MLNLFAMTWPTTSTTPSKLTYVRLRRFCLRATWLCSFFLHSRILHRQNLRLLTSSRHPVVNDRMTSKVRSRLHDPQPLWSSSRPSVIPTSPDRTDHPSVRLPSIRQRFLPSVRPRFFQFVRHPHLTTLTPTLPFQALALEAPVLSQSRTRSWHHLCHFDQLFQLVNLVKILGLILALSALIQAQVLPF